MCRENHQLSYKCRQLKNAGKIHSTWFWNNSVHVKLNERSQPIKIHHVIDIEKLLRVDNVDHVLESSLCKALSLTGHEVKPDDLQACYRLKKKDTLIVKFKCRKQKRNVLINRKNLHKIRCSQST